MGATSSKTTKKQFTIKDSIKYRKYYKTFAIGSGAFLIAFLISSVFAPVQNSDASTVEISNSLTGYFIRITSADSLPISVEASPSGQLAIAKDTLNVITNAPNGYKLYVSTSTNDNNIYAGGSSANSGQGYFSPISGSISTPVSLTQNTWGFALDKTSGTSASANFADVTNYSSTNPSSDATFSAVPTYANSETAKISELTTYNSPAGTDLDIFYGVNASTSLPAGNYSAEVVYTAVAEGVNVFDTMQDFTAEKCDNMSTDSSINLTDARDGKYYRVTKMKDGHCWMTDNLALDGTDKAGNVRTLTPNDSDVTSNVTLAQNIESGTPSNATDVQIFSGVANQTTADCDLSVTPYCIENDTKYGNLYNWFAATARSGTSTLTTEAPMSICPKGWRLPSNNGDWSYANLLKAYGAGDGSNVGPGDVSGEYVRIAQRPPLYFTLPGYYGNAPQEQGPRADYWTRNPISGNSANAYDLTLNAENGYFRPQNANAKSVGFSVRCVFSGQKDEIMQNFTATMCNNLALSTASADNRKTMIDSRDGKFYKISRLADNPGTTGSNGTCWMVSNLALDGADPLGTVRTLTPSDSNVSANVELRANVTDEAADVTKVQISSAKAEATTSSCSPSVSYCAENDIKYGNYYNWFAATAKTGTSSLADTDAGESVCPSGWRLPSDSGNRSWSSLLFALGYPSENAGPSAEIGAQVKELQASPLWVNLPGFSNGSDFGAQGMSINIWSRTATDSSSKSYDFYLEPVNGSIRPHNPDWKNYRFTVRCVTE